MQLHFLPPACSQYSDRKVLITFLERDSRCLKLSADNPVISLPSLLSTSNMLVPKMKMRIDEAAALRSTREQRGFL